MVAYFQTLINCPVVTVLHIFKSFPAYGGFSCLIVASAYSLDTDPTPLNVRPVDQNVGIVDHVDVIVLMYYTQRQWKLGY